MMPFLLAPLAVIALLSPPAQAVDKIGDSWDSLTADDRVQSWPVADGRGLTRACACKPIINGERICYCTQPKPTLEESLKTPVTLDVQRPTLRVGDTPSRMPVLRSAGQP